MRILVLGLNYSPEPIGIGPYTAGMCEGLAGAGHTIRAIVGHPYYPQWRVPVGYGGGWHRREERQVSVLRCPHYVPRMPSGTKRLLHHASFAAAALPSMVAAAIRFRPDIVFTVAPSLVSAPLALLAARLSGASSWLHVQDFEVEAALATGLLPRGGALAALAGRAEHRLLRAFDHVSSISSEMCGRLARAGVADARIHEFRNWADINAIQPIAEGTSSYRAQWGISTPHIALYSGNIANKQGIELVIEAAARLRHRNDLTFVVCGQGPNRSRIEAQAQGEGLTNVRFCDLQPRERLGDLLGLASVHLLPQLAGAADLVLPSKLTNMLASGRPVVVTAEPQTGLAREVAGCGVIVPPEDAAAFAGAIERLIDDPSERVLLGLAARRRAEIAWDRHAIIQNLDNTMTAVRALTATA